MNTRKKTGALTPVRNLTYISFFTALLTICAWIRLPFAIPLTLQSFGIFISMALLGGKLSFFSVLLYLLLGSIGLPVFSGFAGGIGYLLGSTGGFIFGFIFPPLFLWLMENITKKTKYKVPISALLGLFCCYATGTLWYMLLYAQYSKLNILSVCVLPFILPDLIKLLLALTISTRLKKHIKFK